MKTTAYYLSEVRKLHAHQGKKVVKAYVLQAFRRQFGIQEISAFNTYSWASYCWDHNLPDSFKPFLKK